MMDELVMGFMGKTARVTIGIRTGEAVKLSLHAMTVLNWHDFRIRIIESRPTGCWIDSLHGTVFASLGDIVIWFPDEFQGQWLVLPHHAARFLLGDKQVGNIPTPVGTTAQGKREEGGEQLSM